MRNRRFISLNIAISFISKGAGLAINFVLFKILLDCIGQKEYGVWLTLNSVFAWFSFFDMGIGSGLKNKLSTSIALNQLEKAKSYVSTSYFMYTAIFTIVSIAFFFVSRFINWSDLLKIQEIRGWELSDFISLLALLFGARFVLNLIISIGTSLQISAIVDIQGFFINITTFLLCILVLWLEICSFFTIALVHSLVPLLVLVVITIVLFKNRFKFIQPTFSSVNVDAAKELFALGNKFLFLQLSMLFLMTSSSVLISSFVSSEEVVVYNAAFRYFSVISIGFQTISFPFWAAFNDAFVKNDIIWITNAIKKLLWVWLLFAALGLLFLFLSDKVYLIWLSDKVNIPFSLSSLLMIQVLITSWNNIFVFFCNAVNALKIQIILSLIMLFLNIPLAYLLSIVFALKTNGIVITSILLQLLFAIILPFQARRIIQEKRALAKMIFH